MTTLLSLLHQTVTVDQAGDDDRKPRSISHLTISLTTTPMNSVRAVNPLVETEAAVGGLGSSLIPDLVSLQELVRDLMAALSGKSVSAGCPQGLLFHLHESRRGSRSRDPRSGARTGPGGREGIPTSKDSARVLAYLKSLFLGDAGVGPVIGLVNGRLPPSRQASRGSSWRATRRTGCCQIIWNWERHPTELGAARQQAIVQHKVEEGVERKGGTKSHQDGGREDRSRSPPVLRSPHGVVPTDPLGIETSLVCPASRRKGLFAAVRQITCALRSSLW